MFPVLAALEAAFGEEFRVRTALGDPAVLHDQDLVGVADRAEAVGGHHARVPGQKLLEGYPDGGLRAGVYDARRLVEDGGVRKHGAGEGEELAMAQGAPVVRASCSRRSSPVTKLGALDGPLPWPTSTTHAAPGAAALYRLVGLGDAFERQAPSDARAQHPGRQGAPDVLDGPTLRLLGQVVEADQPDRHVLEQ